MTFVLSHILADNHTFSPPAMGHSFSAAIRPPFVGGLCRSVPIDEYDESQHSRFVSVLAVLVCDSTRSISNRPLSPSVHSPSVHSSSIHILDDDSLLNIFCLYRPALFDVDEDEAGYSLVSQGGEWVPERWWYKFTHVCRRWRYLVFASASYLGLCLVCTYGTPVADMLAYSPSLPLIIDYVDQARRINARDEGGIILALQHCDRVRRIRLQIPIPVLHKVLLTIGDEFSMLEYMYIMPTEEHIMGLILPRTFQAPHLRHLILMNFAIPIRSPLLTSAVGLVTLSLERIPPSSYFRPSDLLQRLSLMPQLEVLGISFRHPAPNREFETQLLDTPTMTHIALPKLRWFGFCGASAYLEVLLPQMTTPLLKKLDIIFSSQLTFYIPHLLQFISTRENFQFRSAEFLFSPWALKMLVYPHRGAKMYTLGMEVLCTRLDWQVESAAQVFEALRTAFSAVEHITLRYGSDFTLLEDWENAADRSQWRELLRSFGNVKSLRVLDNDLATQVSYSLRPDDEESPLELLPELKKLEYSASMNAGHAFASFAYARRKAGHPVTLTLISPGNDRELYQAVSMWLA